MKTNIGMIGLAVMGENLALNIESKGFSVSGYDIDLKRSHEFKNTRAKDKNIEVFDDLESFIESLEVPRKIMMMIKAGNPVDQVIGNLLPLLEEDDIIIDGGNSNYLDTIRRTALVESHKLLYIGTGVSGGEEGALNGPSIMPGGSEKAWDSVAPIFKKIAAKTVHNDVCCEWIGPDGAGHYVKMVHNGIEYGDIQLITEVYHIMRDMLGMSPDEMGEVFSEWNKGELDSYLIEITANILKYKDVDGSPLIDKVLDTAGQKGTGKWTSIEAINIGVPLSIIAEAVMSRFVSSLKEERVEASKIFDYSISKYDGNKKEFLEHLKNALYISKIASYAQGFALLKMASKEYNWDLDFGSIAMMWRGGCIIRSAFLDNIKEAFDTNKDLNNLMLDAYFKNEIVSRMESLRTVLSQTVLHGVPTPTLSMSIAYYDSYTCDRLPANLLQAQRDYFGAHTYERTDKKRGEFFHTNWTGKGGTTSSTTYNV